MRLRALVFALLALLAAVPASAGSKYVGTWYAGDNVRLLRLDVRDDHGVAWGTAVGKGYIPTLEVRLSDDSSIFVTISGAWQDTTETAALFSIGSVSALAPTPTVPATANLATKYDAVLLLVKGSSVTRLGADGQASPFTFIVRAWP